MNQIFKSRIRRTKYSRILFSMNPRRSLYKLDDLPFLFNSLIDEEISLSEDNIFNRVNAVCTDDQGVKEQLVKQLQRDIKSYLSEQKRLELEIEIEKFIVKEGLEIREADKQHNVLKAMAAYATSHRHYGPVILEWALSLLDTALVEGRKLIFLARDGIAPYKAARHLKKVNSPKYNSIDLSLVYISRTLAYSSSLMDEKISSSDRHVKRYVQSLKKRDPFILKKYIVQETGLKEKDRCIFIDVGFGGSLIPPIMSQLQGLGIDAEFCYLISHTTKTKVEEIGYNARGFLAHREKRPLNVVDKAGGNPAIHWIEDTHQSIVCSAKILITSKSGKIVPATVVKVDKEFQIQEVVGENPSTCKHLPDEYLVKTYGLKGVLDAVYSHESKSGHPVAWREASEARRMDFGEFLDTFHNHQRVLLIKH